MTNIMMWLPANDASPFTPESLVRAKQQIIALGFNLHLLASMDWQAHDLGVVPKQQRLDLLQSVFSQEKSGILMSLYGGYSTNLLLNNLALFSQRPDIVLSGKSDTTCLQNALFAKYQMKSIYGIDISKLANPYLSVHDKIIIKQALQQQTLVLSQPNYFNQGNWYIAPPYNNIKPPWHIFNKTTDIMSGTALGGNLESLLMLTGTEWLPDFTNHIIILECEANISPGKFLMHLQALIHSSNIQQARAILLGTFSPKSILNKSNIMKNIIDTLNIKIPFITNIDISHTEPSYPFYIGGNLSIDIIKKIIQVQW